MSGLGLFFALVSALAWTGLDATRKALTPRASTGAIVAAFGLGQVPVFATWAAVSGEGFSVPPAYALPGVTVLVLNLTANVLFVVAVRVSPLTLTVPFLSFTPVFTAIVARPLLGEVPAPGQIVGVALVVLGALGLHAGSGDASDGSPRGILRGLAQLPRAFLEERGSVLMVVVALLWSGSGVADKLATKQVPVPVHATLQNAGLAIVVLAFLGVRGRLGDLRALGRVPGWVLASVFFAGAALGFQLLAIQETLVALVETVKRGVGNLVTAVVGRALFGERVSRGRAIALAVMAAGTALVTLSGRAAG
ncbi:MAG TPA: DMT family transporter [Polyangiaceae bacterium LLY-WYZ-14_1]|nr:DMT family transporter [Polyangiaceae bacterium LLY-WYZ-14_1]